MNTGKYSSNLSHQLTNSPKLKTPDSGKYSSNQLTNSPTHQIYKFTHEKTKSTTTNNHPTTRRSPALLLARWRFHDEPLIPVNRPRVSLGNAQWRNSLCQGRLGKRLYIHTKLLLSKQSECRHEIHNESGRSCAVAWVELHARALRFHKVLDGGLDRASHDGDNLCLGVP